MKDDFISGLWGVLIIVALLDYVPSSGWFNTGWYAVEYGVDPSKVQVDAKPKDCDFMHAPFGDKACHYDAKATAYNAAGQIINDRVKYSRDTNGKAIISYDDGKTWVWDYGSEIPDTKINSVVVTWSKVTD